MDDAIDDGEPIPLDEEDDDESAGDVAAEDADERFAGVDPVRIYLTQMAQGGPADPRRRGRDREAHRGRRTPRDAGRR